jgi:hypothetical protein
VLATNIMCEIKSSPNFVRERLIADSPHNDRISNTVKETVVID